MTRDLIVRCLLALGVAVVIVVSVMIWRSASTPVIARVVLTADLVAALAGLALAASAL